MSSRLLALTFDAVDPMAVAVFWAELLGRPVVPEPRGALVPGDETQVGLRFVESDTEKAGPNALHLHLTSATPEDQLRTVAAAVSLGGQRLDWSEDPDDAHIVVADAGGNEFCVIEAGNGFLAGTGFLGEVACDGARDVGVFWHEALGWPLVWDQDDETAVQSPAGGTKVAWGGAPEAPGPGRNRQRFDLVTDDLDAEVERLVELGATRLGDMAGGVELADPGGNEFAVRPE